MFLRRLLIAAALLGTAMQAGALPDGHALYLKYCNACHQTDGAGGIGLPLTAKKLKDVSDQYLFNTVRNGRPGRVMPSFMEMSDAQVDAIVRFLRERSGTKDHAFDPAPLQGDVKHGEQLFTLNCVVCHGPDGTGEGKGTGVTLSRERSFLVMPPAISNAGFQAAANDRQIRRIISVGREQSGMPAFGKKGLSEQDLNDLVAYVRVLGKRAASKRPPEKPDDGELSHVYESPYDFETTVANVKQAIVGANFRTFPSRFLEQGLIDEFSRNERQVGIRFCNFKELYGMIAIEPRLGVVLPCRVTVMERDDGSVILVTPNLRVESRWFNNDELVNLWNNMEETFEAIVEEATL
jgi:cytochrome c oxidase cbb3-type subunit III